MGKNSATWSLLPQSCFIDTFGAEKNYQVATTWLLLSGDNGRLLSNPIAIAGSVSPWVATETGAVSPGYEEAVRAPKQRFSASIFYRNKIWKYKEIDGRWDGAGGVLEVWKPAAVENKIWFEKGVGLTISVSRGLSP